MGADLGTADGQTKRLGAVLLLPADEPGCPPSWPGEPGRTLPPYSSGAPSRDYGPWVVEHVNVGSRSRRGRRPKRMSGGSFNPPPPVGAMWKEGFEASPLSPAGELQRYGAFFDGLRSGSVRSRKAIAVVLGAVLILVLIALIAWAL